MARKPITISVPEWLEFFIDDRVKGGAYGSVSEYFRDLLRQDMQRQGMELQGMQRQGIQRQMGSAKPADRSAHTPKSRFQLLASAARSR